MVTDLKAVKCTNGTIKAVKNNISNLFKFVYTL